MDWSGNTQAVKLLFGDCIEKLKELEDNSIDAIVTDPPYGLGFMGKQWDTFDKTQFGIAGAEGINDLKVKKNFKILPRIANGYELYNFCLLWATECLRVLKPGGYLLSFGGTRTYHRMACAIEDAGFEIRDQAQWIYGSGFPKSLNIGKAIISQHNYGGSSPKQLRKQRMGIDYKPTGQKDYMKGRMFSSEIENDIRDEKIDNEWNGWGTALKPANEPICVARKPISEKNMALNVLKWGTGGLNIDECRIGTSKVLIHNAPKGTFAGDPINRGSDIETYRISEGRFPSNLILDEDAAKILDKQSGIKRGNGHWSQSKVSGFGKFGNGKYEYLGVGEKDIEIGGASRFFYVPKASKKEKSELNTHPTVKPVKLLQYLVRLVCKKGGVVLDPFMGSGTTGIACKKEGMNFVGIEKEEEYFQIAKARIEEYGDAN